MKNAGKLGKKGEKKILDRQNDLINEAIETAMGLVLDLRKKDPAGEKSQILSR